jgi:hypothetical protein
LRKLYIPRLTIQLEGKADKERLQESEELYEENAREAGYQIVWCTTSEAVTITLFEAREGEGYELAQQAFMDGLARYMEARGIPPVRLR